jgi:ADP-ribose pyrophosphatase YjhB (NUDIX family)
MRDWRHCPRCAADLERRVPAGDDEERLLCPACGLVLYENPAPTAGAIVEDGDGRLMLVRRAIEPFKGKWDVPGGFIKPGEDGEDALRRELDEELGVEVGVGAAVAVIADTYGADGVPTLNIFYLARIVRGQPRPADDVAEVAWFRPGELPPPSEIAFPCVRELLARRRPGLSQAGPGIVNEA